MRHLITLAAVAALAGCTVGVEGAACATPGSAEGCPEGQKCGAGKTCSVAAAGCDVCNPGDLKCDVDGDVKECSAARDPACGDWKTVHLDCAAGVTTCGQPVGVAAFECRCERFVVDPAAPSGGSCPFPSLAEAIAEAQRFGVAEVWLGGAAGSVYGVAAADPATVVIPAGMKVAGDDTPPAPASRFLEAKGPGTEAVRLEAGATLTGVTVRRGSAGPALGVRLVGATPSGQTTVLLHVQVQSSGGNAFATGVRVEGSGAVALDSLTVRGATTSGLEVARTDIADTVEAFELVVDGEAAGPAVPPSAPFGVSLSTGDLTLTRAVVKRSAGAGVVALGSGVTARLTVESGSLHDNFGTGLLVQLLDRLSVTGTKICRNKGGAPRNINGTQRLVGGAFLVGAAPAPTAQAFTGNRFFDNDGDQVAIGLGSGTWNLAGPSTLGATCAAGVNAFAGYATGAYGLVAAGNVDVSWDAWPSGIPALGQDVLKIGSPTLVLGTEFPNSSFCSLPPDLTCPAP